MPRNRHVLAHGICRCLLVPVALWAGGGVTAPAVADQFHGLNPGAPIWNGSLVLTPAKANLIAATGTNALRVNFRLDAGATSWNSTQLGLYDQVIQNARDAGMTVLGLFSNETVAGGQTAWNDDPDQDGRNGYVDDFADTAQQLVDRYKDNVKQWEIWNEPNAWTEADKWQSDPQNAGGTYILPRVYAEMLSETYRRLNTEGQSLLDDHNITLATGGLLAHDIDGSFSTAMPYMEQVYDRTDVWNGLETETGRRYPWDDFGYHLYVSQGALVTAPYLESYLGAVRSTQAANNDPSTVVVTEFGWQTVGTNTEELQRDNMSTAYDVFAAQGYVSATYWYQWGDEDGHWGIVHGDGTHKLSYDEFAARNGGVVLTTEHAADDSGLSQLPSSADLLQGLIAVERPGDIGWHPANPASDPDQGGSLNANGLPAFTDGVGDLGTGVTGLLNDFPASGAPAKLLEYDLGGPHTLDEIRIFTGNDGQDGRIFSTTVVWTSTDGVQFDLLGYFQSDPSGTLNNASTPGGPDGATLVSMTRADGEALAQDVTHLQFDFYSVDNTLGEMRDPFAGVNPFTGADDGFSAAFVSPLVREIDLLGAPSLLLGDLNGDGQINDEDIGPFIDRLLHGPYVPAADMNGDGALSGLDIDLFVNAVAPSGTQAVPEPTALALALAGLAGLAGRLFGRRRYGR